MLFYSPAELKSAGESFAVELVTPSHLLNKVAGAHFIHQLSESQQVKFAVELVTFRHLLNEVGWCSFYSPAERKSAGEHSEVEQMIIRHLLNEVVDWCSFYSPAEPKSAGEHSEVE